MPDNATNPRTHRTKDLDAGWGELLGDGVPEAVPADARTALPEHEPGAVRKRGAKHMLAQMARMLDVGEGTGPLVDLRRVLAPELSPSSASAEDPMLEPVRASEPGGASERTLITRRPRDRDDAPLLLELRDDAPEPVDEADDAPRLLALADAIPQPIEGGEESWPRGETRPVIVKPVEPVPMRASGESSAVRSGPVAVVPPAVTRWPYIAGAVALIGALGWTMMRDDDTPKRTGTPVVQAASLTGTAEPSVVAAGPRAVAKPTTPEPPEPRGALAVAVPVPVVAPIVPAPITAAAAAPAQVPEAAPEPAPAPVPEAAPAPVAVIEGSASELLASAESALDAARFEEAHTLASRAWDDAHDNAAVRVMALAACELPDGALARAAFRKLGGPPIRKEVYARCRARAVDVRSNVEGYTPSELLAKARGELERGKHEQAYEHARASNRLTHSAEALELMATSACHQHDADDAAHLLTMLPRDRKRAVQAVCTSAGTTLPG